MPSIPEDTTAPAGSTVGALFGSNFNDSADQQQSAGDPAGSAANTLAGIAITGNAADPSQGAWQYSTDNGASWQTIATSGLSDSNALVLSSTAELRFLPTANYNGVPGQLTTRLIDSSDVVVSGSVTGAALGTGDMAISGVDVSGAQHGGTTAVSAANVTLGIDVTAVNDAPVATGSATLGTVDESDPHPSGSTVGTLFGGDFNDSADQQQSATNTTGSTANTLAGIAIVGDGASASQGTWQYSSDGGKTWSNIPATGLSDTNALVLSSTDSVRFLPSGTFAGTPGALTVRLIDSSAPAPIKDAAGVDLGAVGGISAYSADTLQLTTKVNPSNPPVLSTPTVYIPDYNAPNDYNKLGDGVEPGDLGNADSPFGSPQLQWADPAMIPNAPTRGYLPDIYGEPIIPQVWLTGSVGSRFVIEQQQAIIQVPSDLFNDTYPNAQLEYEARAPGGGPLPSWLIFDARNLTFAGTPPAGSHGTVEVEIAAEDQFGNHATAQFQITVGRESRDLDQLLAHAPVPQQASHPAAKQPGSHSAQRATQQHDAHGEHRGPHRNADANQAQSHRPVSSVSGAEHHGDSGSHSTDGPHGSVSKRDIDGGTAGDDVAQLSSPGRSAFSAQLRDAGPVGKIIQARQMVRSIVEALSGEVAS